MTKEQFLKDFDDINFMYNNAMMNDSLERHIDDLLETELEKIKAEIEKHNIADFIAVQSVLDILNKHISELKGNKQ